MRATQYGRKTSLNLFLHCQACTEQNLANRLELSKDFLKLLNILRICAGICTKFRYNIHIMIEWAFKSHFLSN